MASLVAGGRRDVLHGARVVLVAVPLEDGVPSCARMHGILELPGVARALLESGEGPPRSSRCRWASRAGEDLLDQVALLRQQGLVGSRVASPRSRGKVGAIPRPQAAYADPQADACWSERSPVPPMPATARPERMRLGISSAPRGSPVLSGSAPIGELRTRHVRAMLPVTGQPHRHACAFTRTTLQKHLATMVRYDASDYGQSQASTARSLCGEKGLECSPLDLLCHAHSCIRNRNCSEAFPLIGAHRHIQVAAHRHRI